MNHETPTQRYRRLHPKSARQAAKRWRDKNPESMALLNRRNKYAYRLCVQWVKQYHPEVLEAAKKEARKRWPVSDLSI